jgi:hypothetical protein
MWCYSILMPHTGVKENSNTHDDFQLALRGPGFWTGEAGAPTMDLRLCWCFWASPRELTMSRRDLASRYPQDTSVPFSYLPVLHALGALNQNDPAKAMEMTKAVAPYDFAVPGTAYFTGPFFGALYPVCVRGLAYSRRLSFKKYSIIQDSC